MPNSMFGSPSRLLTQSVFGSAPTTSGNGGGTPTPVYQQPPSFADFCFGTIGKPPNLLSRISAHDSTKVISRSPSPVTLPPLPVSIHERVPNPRKLVERIQMDFSQQDLSVTARPSVVVHEPVSKKPRMNRNHFPKVNPPSTSSNLIPPVEILTVSESNTPPSSMYMPFQTLADRLPSPNEVREALTPELVYPATTPTIEQFNLDGSSWHDPSGSSEPDSPVASPPQAIQNPVSLMQIPTPSPNLPSAAVLSSSQTPEAATAKAPQQQVAQDTLSAIHERLRAKSNVFSSLSLPTLHPRSLSPLAVPSSISELAAGIRNEMDTEEDSNIVLRHPYPQSSSTSIRNVYRELLSSDNNALALTSSKTPNLPASRNTHLSSLVEAMKKLQTAAGTAVQIQLDADRAFESERMEFDEHRKIFEERMLAREAEYQAQMQAVQKQLEELRAREQRIIALEEDSRLREESRCARDAQHRARDEQRQLEDESRRKTIQDEIADAMQLLEEAKAEKRRWQEERERAERDKALVQNNAPPLHFSVDIGPRVEQEDGMTEEEIKTVNQYNTYWVHLNTKVQPLIARTRQLFDTLQRMKETRLHAAEAERRRIADEEERRSQAEEERQRILAEESAQAEAESQRILAEESTQAEAERQRILAEESARAEAERQRVEAEEAAKRDEEKRRCRDQVLNKQQPVSIGGERLLQAVPAQQQAHPELQETRSALDIQAEYARRRAQVLANKQQITFENASRIRAQRAELVAASATHGGGLDDTVMDMEVDGLESPPVGHTVLLASQNGTPPRKLASKKKTASNSQATSYNMMLGTPSTTSRPPDAHTPSTPTVPLSYVPASYKTPSFVSASTEAGRQVITDAPLYPTEFASELNRSSPPNGPVPTSKNIPFSTTPKSRTILQVASQINECTVGPPPPANQDANLRHIKKNRCRLQNNSGDRHVKQPNSDDGLPTKTIKTEEMVDMPHDPEPSNTAHEGVATRPMDATDLVQHHDPPHAHVVLNSSDSQQNDVPQTSTEPIILTVSSCANPQVASAGDASRPMLRISTTPISPDPWDMDASVRRGWNAKPVSPHSEPSEPAYHHAPEEGSRQHSQTSARTPPESPTRSQHTCGGRHYADHHSPHSVSPTSSRPRLEQDKPRASRPPTLPPRPPPRPRLTMTNDRKRPAESDNEDDSRDRRRPRGDSYRPERGQYSRNVPGLPGRHSPTSTAERRMGRSISPNDDPYFYRPPSPERRIRYSPTIHDRPRRVRNEGRYRPDYANITDSSQHPSNAGYRKEEHYDEPQEEGIALLERLSSAPTQAGHANPARGRGRGRGDSGRGRGGRGRTQPPFQSKPLEERLS